MDAPCTWQPSREAFENNFGLHPMVFSSLRSARELLDLADGEATYWVAELKHRECAASVIASVEKDRTLVTTAVFIAKTEDELYRSSGVGGALGFIASLGFLVAVVIVGQTLLANFRQHRRELAMLKALGAGRAELLGFVVWQVSFISIVGTCAGTVLALSIRAPLDDVLAVRVILPTGAVALGLFVMIALCAAASLGSARAVLAIEADEVLR